MEKQQTVTAPKGTRELAPCPSARWYASVLRDFNAEIQRERAIEFLKKPAAALLLALLLPLAAHAADKAPRHVTKPVSTITVKVVSAADFTRGKLTKDLKPWRITTADADSCVAWVSTAAPNVSAAELAAFKACRQAVDRAVDGAAARSEAKALPACTSEDAGTGPSPCLWDCKTMGNRQCGQGTPRYLVITKD